MYFIYALTDPRTDEIRYIGKAKNLKRRFGHHMVADGSNSEKDSWMQELINVGLMPSFKTLETVEARKDANEREAYWIRYYAERGERLTNIVHHNKRNKRIARGPEPHYSGPEYIALGEDW